MWSRSTAMRLSAVLSSTTCNTARSRRESHRTTAPSSRQLPPHPRTRTTQSALSVSRFIVNSELYGCTTTSLPLASA